MLLGWSARPQSRDFALAFGTRDGRSCNRGEDGKFPQFCRYLPLQDDIASVAYWYQTLPTAPFPALPDRDYLEII